MSDALQAVKYIENGNTQFARQTSLNLDNYRYREVRVMLLVWEEDDTKSWEEVETLARVFKSACNYGVDLVKIRS